MIEAPKPLDEDLIQANAKALQTYMQSFASARDLLGEHFLTVRFSPAKEDSKGGVTADFKAVDTLGADIFTPGITQYVPFTPVDTLRADMEKIAHELTNAGVNIILHTRQPGKDGVDVRPAGLEFSVDLNQEGLVDALNKLSEGKPLVDLKMDTDAMAKETIADVRHNGARLHCWHPRGGVVDISLKAKYCAEGYNKALVAQNTARQEGNRKKVIVFATGLAALSTEEKEEAARIFCTALGVASPNGLALQKLSSEEQQTATR